MPPRYYLQQKQRQASYLTTELFATHLKYVYKFIERILYLLAQMRLAIRMNEKMITGKRTYKSIEPYE